MTDDLPLAAEFPPASREDWLKLVRSALKERPFERLTPRPTTAFRSSRSMAGRPAPARSRRAAAPGRCRRASIIPIRPSPTPRRCTNWQNGATGLTLVFAGSIGAYGYGLPGDAKSVARVLEGVHLDAIAIELQTAEPTRDAADHVAALVKSRGHAPGRGQHPFRPRRHRRAHA